MPVKEMCSAVSQQLELIICDLRAVENLCYHGNMWTLGFFC
jgi:hypothetical protein